MPLCLEQFAHLMYPFPNAGLSDYSGTLMSPGAESFQHPALLISSFSFDEHNGKIMFHAVQHLS